MKILHLISQHPESTGSGIYLQNIIRQATAAGHSNVLLAGISADRLPELDCIDEHSCRYISFGGRDLDFTIPGMSDVMPYASSRFCDLSVSQLDRYEQVFADAIASAIFLFSPDIIHSHHLWLASAVARRVAAHLPLVTSCHSTDLRQFVQCPHLRERVQPHCRQIDRILALSRDQAAKISEIMGVSEDKIALVGGGYDQKLFTVHEKVSPEPVQLLYAGKLSLAKGVDWLLRTFPELDDKGLHLHLVGSGTGEGARKCLEAAEKAGRTVTVHGRVSQQELAGLMAGCHLFVLPSFYEGLPLVLLEALASGCRIITTDLPGCTELLAGADPDLVEFIKLPAMKNIDRPDPRDWQVLQRRMTAAITSMAARVRRAPSPAAEEIRRITSVFGWDAVYKRIDSVYKETMMRSAG